MGGIASASAVMTAQACRDHASDVARAPFAVPRRPEAQPESIGARRCVRPRHRSGRGAGAGPDRTHTREAILGTQVASLLEQGLAMACGRVRTINRVAAG